VTFVFFVVQNSFSLRSLRALWFKIFLGLRLSAPARHASKAKRAGASAVNICPSLETEPPRNQKTLFLIASRKKGAPCDGIVLVDRPAGF
jgi:hypothetical protein